MKRRKAKRRKSKKRILILCEGKTEKNYFLAIKQDPEYKQALSAVSPEVVAAGSPTQMEVVNEAIKRKAKEKKSGNPYGEVWVVFDHDNHKLRRDAYDKGLKSGFRIAFSSICFEQWYLLHFKKSGKSYSTPDDLIRALKKEYLNYVKAKQNDFANLKGNLEIAFENVLWLRKQSVMEEKHITDLNPWTDVDVLVRELIEIEK